MSKSDSYLRYPEEIENRLDENYNHPRYDKIDSMIENRKVRDIKNLGNKEVLVNIISGKTPKNIRYYEEGIPFLGASNVNEGFVDILGCPKLDEDVHSGVLNSSKISKGDLLITMAGSIGRCAVYPFEEEANCNQAVAVLKLNEKEANPYYVAEYLNSKIGQLFFGKLQHISSQPNINLMEIQKILLVLPSPDEQKDIVGKTSIVWQKIREIRNDIQKRTDEIYISLLNELNITEKIPKNYFIRKGRETSSSFLVSFEDLDRFHFLFNHPKMKLINNFAKKFKTTNMTSALQKPIIRGDQPDYVDSGEVIVIKTIDMKNKFIDLDNCLRVSEDFYNNHQNAQIQRGDIIIASTGYGSMGKVDIFESDDNAVVDGHISILRVNDDYDPYFLTFFLRSPLGQIQFEKWFSGSSGQIEIQPEDLNNFVIPSTSKDGIELTRQQAIANRSTTKLKSIENLELEINKKRQQINEILKGYIFN